MRSFKTYFYLFVIASIVGIISELVVSEKTRHYLIKPTVSNLLSATILNIYGWSIIMATLFYDATSDFPAWSQILSSGILLTITECIMGHTSEYFHGRKMWQYNQKRLPFCGGYTSVTSSVYFTIMMLGYYLLLYQNL